LKIRVKFYANLGSYLPEGSTDDPNGNEADLEFDDGTTIGDVFESLFVPTEVCHLVLVNGFFIAPSEREAQVLVEGDHLAVWPPVAGG